MTPASDRADVLVVGCGAAGLATALFCRQRSQWLRVVCLDGARHVGAKILVSGGSRCNVTNRVVTERDFWGGSPRFVRHVLRAFGAEQAASFFRGLGVSLHEEEDGKLFPDTNRARSVLDALLNEMARVGVEIHSGQRVADVRRGAQGFEVDTSAGRRYTAAAVVLATGGRSLPKTGSDGFGYELARRLGHGLVETTPGLVPLVLADSWGTKLKGVSHQAALTVHGDHRSKIKLQGSLLWTHFGVSGPLALNASRHWHRASLTGRTEVLLNICPGETFETMERWLLGQERARPRVMVETVLSARLPSAVAQVWLEQAGVDGRRTLAHMTRENRRQLVRDLVETRVHVTDSRGYAHAEVTAGGIPLSEVDAGTMASRLSPGLYLVGEMLDVDGRLGGFNFQWAWSSAWVAARAITDALRPYTG